VTQLICDVAFWERAFRGWGPLQSFYPATVAAVARFVRAPGLTADDARYTLLRLMLSFSAIAVALSPLALSAAILAVSMLGLRLLLLRRLLPTTLALALTAGVLLGLRTEGRRRWLRMERL
jgi:hypothetical protein